MIVAAKRTPSADPTPMLYRPKVHDRIEQTAKQQFFWIRCHAYRL
jgi:hypothetical protein